MKMIQVFGIGNLQIYFNQLLVPCFLEFYIRIVLNSCSIKTLKFNMIVSNEQLYKLGCKYWYFVIFAAAQMWCLGRFLPLIIGNLVPSEDERGQLFNMLLDINDIVFPPVVNEDSIGVLEGLIEEHHATFIGLYPRR